ncbi:diaminobutyrate acetyltransferase [Nocardia elegans]|jgi:L-2,4-diaminobutyric acid acetyltransferase|uniref:L-2,4-diaminobutyric acid acetyltransferase n=3 Tax=Nocardia TaxID=1817 RepID=A0A2T2YZR3_9NOCA|nr:diaminobutyrate acetyltransferase [Nocardia nova]MBF6243208.1 diaminobutyrate acetyltransferase [Nocardia elegans]MBF6450253.1 diaminobutyrate acetyltransferase [Nocardia elegans]MDN2497764.1 diaminobutyrate acetyltransferase [Nocardia nova]PPJ17946.1 diaminobutyrate acetyltransferase [Nocardia nova]
MSFSSPATDERNGRRNVSTQTLIRRPRVDDGARMWRIAVDSQVLDANSSYAYLLWSRDFASTTVVAEIDSEIAGFVTGYLRPESPDTLFIWQVAVDHAFRGRGVGVAMLDRLVEDVADQGVSKLETTVSPDNEASLAMFASLARRRDAEMTRETLFEPEDFPDGHESEDLYRIAPLQGDAKR